MLESKCGRYLLKPASLINLHIFVSLVHQFPNYHELLSDIEIISCVGRQINLMTSLVLFTKRYATDHLQVYSDNLSASFLYISALINVCGMSLGTQSTIIVLERLRQVTINRTLYMVLQSKDHLSFDKLKLKLNPTEKTKNINDY